MRDEEMRRDANRSPTSIRSDPTADATAAKAGLDDDAVELWGSDGQFLSGEENDDEDGEGDSSSESEESSDAEMVDDEAEGPDDDVDHMELIGHR